MLVIFEIPLKETTACPCKNEAACHKILLTWNTVKLWLLID